MLRRQKYVAKLRRFLKQLELVGRLRHYTFSKLSQASNCFEKVCGSVYGKAEDMLTETLRKLRTVSGRVDAPQTEICCEA
jgi:hypothetical protein